MSAVLEQVITTKRLVTVDDMLLRPEDGFRYELINGELRQKPLAGGFHGIVAARFGGTLGQYVEKHNLGETTAADGFQLAHKPDTVLIPDVAFVSANRLPSGEFADNFWDIAPDLVFEVIRAGEKPATIRERLNFYFSAGVMIALLAYPRRRTLEVHSRGLSTQPWLATLTAFGILELPEILPGFRYEVGRMFARHR